MFLRRTVSLISIMKCLKVKSYFLPAVSVTRVEACSERSKKLLEYFEQVAIFCCKEKGSDNIYWHMIL